MGYQSDVMTLIYPDGPDEEENKALYGQLKVLMATTFKDVSEEWGSRMTWLDKDRVLKFDIYNVKWYDSFADVQRFHAMLEQFGDISGYCTEFIRIGEDYDDVVVNRSGGGSKYYLNVRQSIDCDV